MVRLPCYMDVTTAQVSFLLCAAPTTRFTQQVATQDTSDCCACQETWIFTRHAHCAAKSWAMQTPFRGLWNDHLHIVAATLMVASWELWIFCSFIFVYPHLYIGELLLNSLHEEERYQRKKTRKERERGSNGERNRTSERK